MTITEISVTPGTLITADDPRLAGHISGGPHAAEIPAAARILAAAFPQIAGFDATGMTTEEVHYFLGESAGVAYFQYQVLTQQP